MTTLSDLTNTKPTHSYSTRVDCRRLAELVIYWHAQGQLPRSASELIRLSVEALASTLVKNDLALPVNDLEVAIETLRRYGMLGQAQPRNLHLEGLSLNRLGEGPRPDAPARIRMPRGGHSTEDFNRALQEMEARLIDSEEGNR